MISSETDSVEAAGRWLDAALAGRPAPPLLIVIGLGHGDLLPALDRRAPQTRVLALEPDPASAAVFLQRADARAWRDAGRLTYLVDPDYSGADDAWRIFPSAPDAHRVIVDPGVARSGGPAAIRAARVAKQIVFGAKANADARRRFAPGYLTGTLHNLPELLGGHDVRSLTNFYAGRPAIIAGAGPSLDAAIAPLSQARDRAVLIAADTALRPLLNHGLSPQLVVAVDPQALNARHFHALPECSRTWLVGEASIDPSVIAAFDQRTFWFRVADHHPWPWFHELGVDVGRIDVWGSVLTAAFQIAVLAGCDPIVLVGADLAFTGGRPYCRGTTYEFDWAYAAANGHSIDRAWHPFLKTDEQIRVPDVGGGETITSGYLQSFRDWLVARAQKSGRRVINATGAGIFFGEGLDQLPLLEALPAIQPLPSLDTLVPVRPSRQLPLTVAGRVRDVRRDLARKPAPAPIDRWKDFTGDGFSAAAVGEALDRAERVLESRARTADTAVARWPGLTDSGSARCVLPELPEAMARLRAAFGSLDLPPASDVVTHALAAGQETWLADAFALLCRLCAPGPRTTELGSLVAIDQHQVGRAPLGALLAWPQPAGWAVRVYEALLGAAWAAPVSRGEESFFSRPVSARDQPPSHTVPLARPGGPSHADQACAALALEWVLCARQLGQSSESGVETLSAWWRSLVDRVGHRSAAVTESGAGLVLDSGAADRIELPLCAGEAELARVLTGTLSFGNAASGGATSIELVHHAGSGRTASVALRFGRGTTADTIARSRIWLPRVLTDAGVPRGLVAYATAGGAVVTTSGGSESVLVREDGTVAPFCAWPHPINGQLPLGASGAVAWGVGGARYPHGGCGYVMWREHLDDEPSFIQLPFGPQAGTWWQNRLYWACFPFGVGSWGPGEDPVFALPDVTLFTVHAEKDGVLLPPRARTATGAPERRLVTDGWRWRPGEQPVVEPAGPLGVFTSRSTFGGWTAWTHREADVIRFERVDGLRATMTCYLPFTATWIGRSLLVATADGELLLFEQLLDVLDRTSAEAGGAS